MQVEKLNTYLENIRTKLGEENSALISDELVNILNDNNAENTQIEKQNNDFKLLQEKYNKTIEVNGNLMQQISMGTEKSTEKTKNDVETKKISFKDCFDEKGNFIIK